MEETKKFKPKLENVEFEEAIEYTGYGKYNMVLILVCGLGLFMANSESCSTGYILALIAYDLKLDTYYKGIFASANFIGLTLGSPVWGYLSDQIGRKKIILPCFFMAFVTGVAASLLNSFWPVAILRFFNGIFVSGPGAIMFAYFGEFHSIKNKAKSMAIFSAFIALALINLPAMAWLVSSVDLHIDVFFIHMKPWQVYLFMCSVPNIVVVLLLLKFPESPKFLHCKQKPTETLSILKKMYTMNTGQPRSTFPVDSLCEKILDQQTSESFFTQALYVFKYPYSLYLFAGSFIQATNFAISSGLFVWYPDITNRIMQSNDSRSLTICEALTLPMKESNSMSTVNDTVFILSIIVGATYLGGYALWGLLEKLLGSRTIFLSCMTISAASTGLLCLTTQPTITNIFFILAMMLPGMCVALVNSLTQDLFPTNSYGIAVCLMQTAGRLGSLIAGSVVGITLEWNCSLTFGIFAASLVLNLVFGFLFLRRRSNNTEHQDYKL